MTRTKRVRAQSTRDRTLPYTYEGWVDILEGRGAGSVYDHFFSDTLCGLIEYLDDEDIGEEKVKLYGVYRGEQMLLDNTIVTDENGNWLKRPALCHALEEHYEHTHEECYRGHVEKGRCSFDDRDRAGLGPIW